MLITHQVHAAAQGWKVKPRQSARDENFNQETHKNNLSKNNDSTCHFDLSWGEREICRRLLYRSSIELLYFTLSKDLIHSAILVSSFLGTCAIEGIRVA
jgi:hypothetical protein